MPLVPRLLRGGGRRRARRGSAGLDGLAARLASGRPRPRPPRRRRHRSPPRAARSGARGGPPWPAGESRLRRDPPRSHHRPRRLPSALTPMPPGGLGGGAGARPPGRRDDVNHAELAFEVVSDLLARTGWSHDRIDPVITASSDFWDGRTISDMAVQAAAGAAGKSASKVSMDGTFALVYAAARIASGAYRTCLVVAHAKASEGH